MQGMGKRVCGTVLVLSLFLGCTSCKKKDKDGRRREVKASDPYFESELIELKLPADATQEVEITNIESVGYQNDKVILNYYIGYKLPEGADPMIDVYDYVQTGTATYDLKGNCVRDQQSTDESGSTVDATCIDKDGNTVALMGILNQNLFKYTTAVVWMNAEGEEIKRVDLDTPWEYDDKMLSSIQILPDGKIVLGGTGYPDYEYYIFDEQGKFISNVFSTDHRSISGEIFIQDGKYYALTTPGEDDESGSFYVISEIDMSTGEIKKGKDAKGIRSTQSIIVTEDGIYSSTSQGISKYNMSTDTMEEVLDWNQTDVDRTILDSIKCYPKNQDEFHVIIQKHSSSYDKETCYLLNLKRAEKNPHVGQKVLYVGGLEIPESFYEYMYSYNSTPEHELRIETIDYALSEDMTMGNQEAGQDPIDKLYLAILSGEGPDILLNFDGYLQFFDESMLVDLNPYIDGEKGLNRSEFFDNIFRSMEVDGKLYQAPVTFYLQGCMINSDVLHVDRNWTLDDLDQAVRSLPDEVSLLSPAPCRFLLEKFVGSEVVDYLDYPKKQVNFSSEGMVKALEEAQKYGSPNTKIYYVSAVYGSGTEALSEGISGLVVDNEFFAEDEGYKASMKLYEGMTAMHLTQVWNVAEYNMMKNLLAEKGKLVGCPTFKGEGVTAGSGISLSIVASTKYKDEAWELIRSFYTEEAQRELGESYQMREGGFAMRKTVFDEVCVNTVEKINRVYDRVKEDASRDPDLDDTKYFRADEATLDELHEIVEGVHCSVKIVGSVWDIIGEEAEGYFAGSRSAEDVLKNIDNRARQIVQEK